MSIVKAFNSHFMEFIDDILTVVPDNKSLKTAKFYTNNIIKLNPILLIKGWKQWFATPYEIQINNGDFAFFMDKDYKDDVGISTQYNSSKVLDAIEPIRNAARQLSVPNQQKIIKYIQNLSKLSKMYKP